MGANEKYEATFAPVPLISGTYHLVGSSDSGYEIVSWRSGSWDVIVRHTGQRAKHLTRLGDAIDWIEKNPLGVSGANG